MVCSFSFGSPADLWGPEGFASLPRDRFAFVVVAYLIGRKAPVVNISDVITIT